MRTLLGERGGLGLDGSDDSRNRGADGLRQLDAVFVGDDGRLVETEPEGVGQRCDGGLPTLRRNLLGQGHRSGVVGRDG